MDKDRGKVKNGTGKENIIEN